MTFFKEELDLQSNQNRRNYQALATNNKNFEDENRTFIQQQRPANTTEKTTYDLNVWKRFCESIQETRNINNIPVHELHILLCKFFMTITKKDGSVYEPSFLSTFQRIVQRYLNNENSTVNIFQDPEFAEEDLLFAKGLFGNHKPEVLQRTVWWAIALHFGFRARNEFRKQKWGGKEILVWRAERGSKARHGDGHQTAFFPTGQAANNRRCPVTFYKDFASHRPGTAKTPEESFFLAVNNRPSTSSQLWYTPMLLWEKTLLESSLLMRPKLHDYRAT